MKTDIFQSCDHCWVFQICWHIECIAITESTFRILNSSTGIPSPPLALFIVMIPKAHLTLHSRMSSSRWMITPSWLSGLWRSILCSFSVYYCHLFLVFSASFRSILFLSFIVPIFEWNFHGCNHCLQWFWSPKNKVWHCFHCLPIYFPWGDGTRYDPDI